MGWVAKSVAALPPRSALRQRRVCHALTSILSCLLAPLAVRSIPVPVSMGVVWGHFCPLTGGEGCVACAAVVVRWEFKLWNC